MYLDTERQGMSMPTDNPDSMPIPTNSRATWGFGLAIVAVLLALLTLQINRAVRNEQASSFGGYVLVMVYVVPGGMLLSILVASASLIVGRLRWFVVLGVAVSFVFQGLSLAFFFSGPQTKPSLTRHSRAISNPRAGACDSASIRTHVLIGAGIAHAIVAKRSLSLPQKEVILP